MKSVDWLIECMSGGPVPCSNESTLKSIFSDLNYFPQTLSNEVWSHLITNVYYQIDQHMLLYLQHYQTQCFD